MNNLQGVHSAECAPCKLFNYTLYSFTLVPKPPAYFVASGNVFAALITVNYALVLVQGGKRSAYVLLFATTRTVRGAGGSSIMLIDDIHKQK